MLVTSFAPQATVIVAPAAYVVGTFVVFAVVVEALQPTQVYPVREQEVGKAQLMPIIVPSQLRYFVAGEPFFVVPL